MARKMFVNLPVTDLHRSMEFFRQLGFEFNLQFTDETAACMVISEENYAMLLTHPKFQEFIPGTISDATKQTEVLVALSCETREEVGELVKKALAAGGTTYSEPKDYGFMLQHAFKDPDGHIWEVFYMDMAAMPPS